MLGVGPILGRVLQGDDAASPGSAPVAVLNHRFWVSSFGADSSFVGRILRIRGVSLAIIGVAPKDFDGLEATPPDFWVPIPLAIGAAATVASALEVMDVFGPVAYVGGAAVVLLAWATGALIPSRRAAQVEPLETIRAD